MSTKFDKLKEIIAHHYNMNASKITEDTYIDDLPGDEFDVIELVLEVEKAFGVKISDRDVEALEKVGDFLAHI